MSLHPDFGVLLSFLGSHKLFQQLSGSKNIEKKNLVYVQFMVPSTSSVCFIVSITFSIFAKFSPKFNIFFTFHK